MNEERVFVDEGDIFWRKHSDGWKSSGLTQLKYCEQEAINYASFVYQHTKLNQKPKRSAMKFHEAKSESTPSSSQTAGLQLMLPNGVRVGITQEVNIGFLQSVLTLAGGLDAQAI